MTARRHRLASALSTLALACAAASTLAACTVENELDELELMDLEVPANEDIEPTAQPCTMGDTAQCLDGESLAFCFTPEDEAVFGHCVAPEELECMPGDADNDWCGEVARCETDANGVPRWMTVGDCGEPPTPLVLRFDSAPVTMIAAEATPAATFDIEMAADGSSCISTDWPSAATPWLAIDLDGNGSIDGGHELFGSGTRLTDGTAPNGFAALAAYDSNRDGQIDARDAAFERLLLWRDHDADRLSTPGELERLVDAGVEGLELDYLVDAQCDARGNCGVERAGFRHAGGVGELVDLHLACQ